MSKNKPNPHRVPCTQADVDKAEDRGRMEGATFMLSMFLWVLHDKHNLTWDELGALNTEVHELADHLNSGRIKMEDITSSLKEEFDITVEIKK